MKDLTLRQYYAIHSPNLWNSPTARDVAEIMGVEVPDIMVHDRIWLDFWTDWEVYKRFRFADAMIKYEEE